MKTKYILSFSIILFGAAVSFLLITNALAQVNTDQGPDIQYPVKELGNCQNETACRAYCDKPENIKPCIAFAEEHNLMPKEEIEMAKKFMAIGEEGPGGCRGKDECDTYCNNIDHMEECISFAIENDLIPPEELKEAKQVLAAIKRGVKPPPCKGKKECDVYCQMPEHMEECIAFGIEAGFIQGKELEDVQKMLAAVKRGVKPPPCRGKDECDVYCNNPDNMEVCMNFAMEAGFVGEQEKEDMQKMLQAIKKGIKPPSCKGKEECDVYCQEESHFEECMNFAVAAGFMNEKEAEMAKKTKGKGPGGCKSKDECETFCNNPDNQQTCFEFGRDNGLIPQEELQRIEQDKGKFKEDFNKMLDQAPNEARDCIISAVGAEKLDKFKSGEVMPPRDFGDQIRTCFEKFGPPPGQKCEGENCPPPGQEGQMMQSGQAGPGGCKTPDECKVYCESNPEECKNFQPGPGAINPGGQMMPQQAGPGGCKGPEECEAYCKSNPDQCKNFGSGGGQGQFAPGTGPTEPCEGENCQQQMQMRRIEQLCTGDNCNNSPNIPTSNMPNTIFKPGEPMKCEGENCPPAGGMPPTGTTQGEGTAPRFPEGQMTAPPGAPMPGTGISPENLPPTGSFTPPPGDNLQPPTSGSFQPPPEGTQTPPPSGTIPEGGTTSPPPPSSETPPPSSSIQNQSLLGMIIRVLFGIVGK